MDDNTLKKKHVSPLSDTLPLNDRCRAIVHRLDEEFLLNVKPKCKILSNEEDTDKKKTAAMILSITVREMVCELR